MDTKEFWAIRKDGSTFGIRSDFSGVIEFYDYKPSVGDFKQKRLGKAACEKEAGVLVANWARKTMRTERAYVSDYGFKGWE